MCVVGTESPVPRLCVVCVEQKICDGDVGSCLSEISSKSFWVFFQSLVFVSFLSLSILQFIWVGYDKGAEFSRYCISPGLHFVSNYVSGEAKFDYLDSSVAVLFSWRFLPHCLLQVI